MILVSLAMLLACSSAAAHESDPVVTSQVDGRALGGGLLLFGGGYGAALWIAASERFDAGSSWLAIPLAGPWLALGQGSEVYPWALALDGVLQTSGALLTSLAVAYPHRTLGPAAGAGVSVHVSRGGAGLGYRGVL
jgi:hypothetical protein